MQNVEFQKILQQSKGLITYDDLTLLDMSLDVLDNIENLKEDLLQIEYSNNLIIDVGWYPSFKKNGAFQIQIVKNSDWMNPVLKYKCKTWELLAHNMEKAVLQCNSL